MRHSTRTVCVSLAAAILCLMAAPLHAHEDHRSNVDVVLDRVTPQPEQLEVRIVDTLAPQMLVTNHTGQTLEILDGHNTPVIRIAPDRTWVNAAAPAYYSEHPMADRPIAAASSKAPRWIVASHDSSWGWFDPRIQPAATQKPATWQITMRLGSQPIIVSGRFRARPTPRGYWMPAIETPHEIAPQVETSIIPGVVPAITLANISAEPVTVIGARGEPFLRIGPDGIFANATSPTWMQSGRAPQTTTPISTSNDPAAARWIRVSPGTRYTWLEWRARCPDDRTSRAPMSWQIPLLIAGNRTALTGRTKWIAVPDARPENMHAERQALAIRETRP